MSYSQNWTNQSIIIKIKQEREHKCHYCGKDIIDKKNDLTVDHRTPVSRGGEYIEENLVICCKDCNQDKGDMTEEEYKVYRKHIEYVLNHDEAILKVKSMIDIAQYMVDDYSNISKEVSDKENERKKLEKIIVDVKFNASEGYNLCRDLKGILIEIERLNKLKRNLLEAVNHAKSSIINLQRIYDKLVDDVIRQERNDLHIHRLKKYDGLKIS